MCGLIRITSIVFSLCQLGCMGESSAAPRKPTQPLAPSRVVATSREFSSPVPSGQATGSGPTDSQRSAWLEQPTIDAGDVRVVIEEVERGELPLAELAANPGCQLLHLKVLVASTRLDPLPLVGPRRFELRYSEGDAEDKRTPPTTLTAGHDPRLPTKYLKRGEEVTGWLSFMMPRKAQKVTLWSNLKAPEIMLTIDMPQPSRVKRERR